MTLRTTPPPNITLKTTAQRRARIKPDLKSKLEEEYAKNPRPTKQDKHRIALAFEMTDDNVHFWFQNRRARASRESKKHKVSSDQGSSRTSSRSSPSRNRESDTTTSSHSKFIPVKDFTSTSFSLMETRPRLPSIGTLFDNQNVTSMANSFPLTHTSVIETYFHHSPPFGIETSYMAFKDIRPLSKHE